MVREVSKKIGGAAVWRAECNRLDGAAIEDAGNFDGWRECEYLIPLTLEDKLAPAYQRAKFLLDLSKVSGAPKKHAWNWREFVNLDDRISIRPRAAAGGAWFCGFVVDVDISCSGGNDETVTVTAVGSAVRLARDVVVYGRHMYQKDPATTVKLYSALAAHFNPGGVPNKHPTVRDDIDGAPGRGVPVFTFDGDLAAEWWTLGDIIDYLSWHYNAAETWVKNAVAYLSEFGDPYSSDYRITLDATGMSLWAALAAACELAGWDLGEACADDGQSSKTLIALKGFGRVADINRQKPDADGVPPPLDFAETNLFTFSLAESTLAAVTEPTVAGGRSLRQITIPLKKAWPPARQSFDPDWNPVDPEPGDAYSQKFVTNGSGHEAYADVCRLWDANTDGRYGDLPWSHAVPDMSALAGGGAGEWPVMPYRPLPLLTTVSVEVVDGEDETKLKPASREAVLEVSFDGGSTWRVLEGWSLAPDRLAIMLTLENVGTIPTFLAPPDPEDYFTACWLDYDEDTDFVQMRLTCTVEAPDREIERPDYRSTAGTGFITTEFFDKGELGQERTLAASSVLGLDEAWSDTVVDRAALDAAAVRIQDACEDRSIEAMLALEWLEGAPGLTDVIQEIAGLDYPLPISRGLDLVYPRVVSRTLDFQNWSCQLSLGTERKSGTTFRPGYVYHALGAALDNWRPQ